MQPHKLFLETTHTKVTFLPYILSSLMLIIFIIQNNSQMFSFDLSKQVQHLRMYYEDYQACKSEPIRNEEGEEVQITQVTSTQ